MSLQLQPGPSTPEHDEPQPGVLVRLLGPLGVERDGVCAAPASGRVSALLALLALEAGRVVSVDRLVDQLWGEDVPASGTAGLHVYVSRLRRLLAGTGARVVTRPPGYLLELPRTAVDVHLLATQLAAAEPAAATGHWPQVLELLGPVRTLWRGAPFVDAHPAPDLQAEAERLERLRDRADELLVRALLALDRAGEAVPLVDGLCRREPLNETFWRLRVRARHALGNDAAALAAYEEFRALLAEELGLDPGERMQRLQLEILRAAPPADLADPAGAVPATPPPTARPASAPTAAAPRSPTGRALERAALEAAVDAAGAGAGRTVVLEGEPGIGKTYLASHAAATARAAGVRVLWARASEGPGTPPWWLWEQLLDALAPGEPDADEPDAAGRPGAAVLRALVEAGADEDADRARFRLCLALVDRVVGAARTQPLLVVLDDVQWADDGTLQAVRLLVQQLSRASCSLVLTARTGAGRTPALEATLVAVGREESAGRHRLAPFTRPEVAGFLTGRGVDQPGAQEVARLHHRSGGNPFYLGELVRAGAAESGPTGTVAGLVQQRLAALDPTTRAVLEVAAVAGSTFAVPVLARALGRPPVEVLDLLEPAAAEGFVVRDEASGRWRFAHDLARDAILDALPPSRRAGLHRQVGDAVADLHADELDEHADELADHRFRASLGLPSEEAFAACTLAADRASRRLSYDQGALHRARALVCLPPGPGRRRERFEVLLRLTLERRSAGDVLGASASLQQAVELARVVDDRTLLARAVAVLGGVTLWNWRQFEQVDHPTVTLLEELVDADDPGAAAADDGEGLRRRVELLGTLAVELYYDESRPRAERYAAEAVGLARRTGDAALLGRALNNYVIAAWVPGRDADRRAALDEALALGGAGLPLATEVVARLHRASLRLTAADLAGSEQDLERASRLAPRLGLLEVEGQVTAQHAGLALLRGDLDAASELVERAHDQLARTSLWGADWVRLVQLTTRARVEHDVHRVADVLVAKASEDAHRPLRWTAVLALAESGDVGQARDLQARWGLRVLGRPYWGSTFDAAQAAETSLLLGAPDPRTVYAALVPLADQLVVAGTTVAVWGPVAALLARLAEVLEDPVAAAGHARQAAALTRRVTEQLGFSPRWPAAGR